MSQRITTADAAKYLSVPNPGDEVVISGIAGRFPESNNLTRLKDNLFNERDLTTDDERRWKLEHPDIPRRTGKVDNIEKFDAVFFGVHSDEAQAMDPMGRMLLEHAYEAIIDAGMNPQQLRGTNTGVFIGSCFSESEQDLIYETNQVNGFGVLGCSRSILANRISHWLGVTGPSYHIDTACSASLFAMDHAYRAIRTGQCDAALVGTSQLCLNPFMSMQYSILGALSSDGPCRCFDADANGYCRSEAICVIYLQKSKDAKRIYADVIYTRTNCDGFTEQGITFPSIEGQSALLEQFYEDCGVPPTSLAYVEAHGTGTKAGDPIELNTLARIFCPGRTTPLRIGSVKSNLGHAEPASGACAIAKVLIAMESGYIPPNLHYNRPREGIEALVDGRLKVITEVTPWDGGYVGINAFGFGGANAHILLKSNPKEKINHSAPNDDLPRLVVVSGRTQEAVETLLDDLGSRPMDVEYISLFHNIHAKEIPGHLYRGYMILPPRSLPENYVRDIQYCSRAKRQVWFLFSGKGSSWPAMGETLLKIPVFVEAVQKCDRVLKPYGVDVIDILTTKDPKIFDNILISLVGMATIQIGLVDVLVSIGIVPDHIIGHSIGELGCAYADGCLTAEQIVLAAYFHGLELMNTEAIPQSLAAVESCGVELKRQRSLHIELACGNLSIGELLNATEKCAIEPQNDDIFAEEERCGEIACWRCNIIPAATKLSAYQQKFSPVSRSGRQKWLTTSAPRECYTDYKGDPVLSNEKSQEIQNNVIVIEIAPCGLLQTILRRSVNGEVTSVASANYRKKDPLELLLQAIGKMYQLGLHPQLSNLYPEVQYPVSRGTPMISPLVRWEHSDDWFIPNHATQEKIVSGERAVHITLSEEEFEWMAGHMIDGRNLIPATGYLVLIWETVALMQGKMYEEVSVVFENVRFHRATTIPKQGTVELSIMVQKGSGRFEITERHTAVVSGFIRATSNPAQDCVATDMLTNDDGPLDLTDEDIYKEFRLRGYQQEGLFRGLEGASLNGTRGSITWKRNWAAFMDNMLQLEILGIDTRSLFVPTSIQKIVIDTRKHSLLLRAMPDDRKAFAAQVHKDLGMIVSGGIEVRGLGGSVIARKRTAEDPILEEFRFVAYRDRAQMEFVAVTRIATQIALENHFGVKIKTIELLTHNTDNSTENLTSLLIHKILSDLPLLQPNVKIIAPNNGFPSNALPFTIEVCQLKKLATESDALLVICHGLFANKDHKALEQLQTTMLSSGFLLAREPLNKDADIFASIRSENLDIILEKRTDNELVLLLRKRPELRGPMTVIQINNYDFSWLSTLQVALGVIGENKRCRNNRILLVSERDLESGLMGLVNCLRKEPGGQVIRGLLIQDLQAPKFSLENLFYSEQLDLDLTLNILRSGKSWGSYRFFAMNSSPLKPVHHFRISQLTRGDLSSLKWVEGPIQSVSQQRNFIEVHYSSINFRDVMISTGKLAPEIGATTRTLQENVLGFEYSGRDTAGRAVMGIIWGGAFSNIVLPDSELLWSVPDNWTLEDAATIPIVYITAYHALIVIGKMKKEDKVLIHAGSGGVGQAAITLALHEGCEVFTTVGTPKKREFIKNQFPAIDDSHIGNSRDTSFEQLILCKTQGQGVDIVLNSLAEEKLQASVRCLNKGGRFIEIGKFDLAANNPLGLEAFLKGISFHGVFLETTLSTPSAIKTELATMLAKGLRDGAVKPLVRTAFTMDQAEIAFRYMAAGRHIGKVILKIHDESNGHQVLQPRGLPRYYCSSDASYLILGGLGGFGLELADWLVLRGSKKIVFTSRKGVTTGYQRLRINIWQNYGVKIVVIVGRDASTPEGCADILKEAEAIGPVAAIFNLAAVLKENIFENQTVESFEESFKVKAWATRQLDKLSRTLCPNLKQFVVFSSVSCGKGNAGQTYYGMANSVMERICEKRVAENLPGLAIQWGAIGDVGMVARLQMDGKELVITGGTAQQKISSCLQELDGFLLQDSPVVSSMVVPDKIAASDGPTNIVEAVTSIMGLKSLKTVSLHRPLMELGLDSMMAIEIKMTLERDFELFLTLENVRSLNFLELDKISLKQSGGDESREKIDMNKTDYLHGILLMRILSTDQSNKDVCVPLKVKSENDGREVFIVPGIDGSHTAFKSLANKLKSPTTCLQLVTTSMDTTSIDEMVDHLIPHVKARSKGRRDFVIAGYSFGTLVAFEIVRRLETEGFSGRLLLFDGSPEYLKALINQHFNATTDDELQSNLLLGMMDILASYCSAKLALDLQNCNTWEEKLTAFTRNVLENENLTTTREEQESICSSVYYRLKSILTYDTSARPPLGTPIILLKPKIQFVHSMSEDYGLGLLTREKVKIYEVEGNHATMLDDDLCAAAINGELVENVFP